MTILFEQASADKTEGMNEAHDNVEHYMFFKNIETIKRMIDDLMQMNPTEVDMLLNNGHDWAADHIASSKDDIQEVTDFFKGEIKQQSFDESINAKANSIIEKANKRY